MDVADLLSRRAFAELTPARQLAAWCGAHGLSLRRLADELGVDPGQLSRVVNGRDRGERIVRAVLDRTGVRL